MVYDQLDQEKNKGFRADPKKIDELEAEVKDAIAKADSFVEENEYDRIVESNGGVGMNAGTGEDSTNYFYSFPANRIELWFLLESERFLHPVFREFYKERDVVREERRMRVESSPQGKLVEALLATAFAAHPYRVMPGGWASDIDNFRAHGGRAILQELLHAGEHHHRDRGRCESGGGEAAGGEIFRDACRRLLCRRWCAPSSRSRKAKSASRWRVAAQPFLVIAYKRPDRIFRTMRRSTC